MVRMIDQVLAKWFFALVGFWLTSALFVALASLLAKQEVSFLVLPISALATLLVFLFLFVARWRGWE